MRTDKSIESRIAFIVGYFGVPIIYLLTSSGRSLEEVVHIVEIQSSLWVFASKMC